MRWDIGMDLGTEFARIAEYKNGVSMETAARLAFREGRDIPICCGDVAARIEGRTCSGVEVCSPLVDGALSSNFYLDRYLRWAFRQFPDSAKGKNFGAMLTCVPYARPVQQEAMLTSCIDAGAAAAALVRSDAVSAIGAGIDLNAPEAKMLVDIGAGKVTATIFTMGRVSAFGYLPYGLDRMDEHICRMVRTDKGFRIGKRTAREVKHTLATAVPEEAKRDLIMHLHGFSMSERMPKVFDMETAPVIAACESVIREIAQLCMTVLSGTPDGIAADLYDAGVVLTGGGAEMDNINKKIGDTLGIPCRIADAPDQCAAKGLFKVMRNPDEYASVIMRSSYKGSGR